MRHIDFPFHFDRDGRTADTNESEHIRDMIHQFMLTDSGERVNRPDFGSGLSQLLFAPNRPELEAALQFTIQSGLEASLSDVIAVQELNVSVEESTCTVDCKYRTLRNGEARSARIKSDDGE